MRPLFLSALLLAVGTPLAAQSYRGDFTTPTWTSAVEFSMAMSLRELSDGRLIVIDFGEGAIRLLAADGRLLHDIGRTGGGPKEFATPVWALALPGDSTLINDRDQQRFLLIGPDGEPVGTIPWPSFEAGGLQDRIDADGNGNLYFVRSVFPRTGRSTALLRWRLRAPRADSIATVQTQVTVRSKTTIDGQEVHMTQAIPGIPGDGWAVGPAGELAVVDPERYIVTRRDSDGTTRQGPSLPFTPVAITTAEWNRMFGSLDALTRAQIHLPTTRPAVSTFDLRMAPNGELWALRTGQGGSQKRVWDIIDRNGRVARSVELSKDRTVVGFGKQNVYVVHTDEDGIQHLEAYR
jgi:hypothetical protein